MNVSLTDKIVDYLQKHPNLRDDWVYLLALLWREQIGPQNHSLSCFVMLGKIARHELIEPESVRRTWQKVLEHRPELRGPEYGKRHKVSEPNFKIELKKLDDYLTPQQSMFKDKNGNKR